MQLFIRGAYDRIANYSDWQAGMDFKIMKTCQYISLRDVTLINKNKYDSIVALDNNGRIVFVVTL
jgi:hypothetical protein